MKNSEKSCRFYLFVLLVFLFFFVVVGGGGCPFMLVAMRHLILAHCLERVKGTRSPFLVKA